MWVFDPYRGEKVGFWYAGQGIPVGKSGKEWY